MEPPNLPDEFSQLSDLLAIDSPAGDEHDMAACVSRAVTNYVPEAKIITVGLSVLAVKGRPKNTVVMAHIDTTGFTLGYHGELIAIGAPAPRAGDILRPIGRKDDSGLTVIEKRRSRIEAYEHLHPGERLLYAAAPTLDGPWLTAPYLDNRAGVWAGLQTLRRCQDIAVAFTAGEEVSGNGARSCARVVYEDLGLSKALIADVTWDTDHVHAGDGPALSLRDANIPNRRFVDRLVAVADSADIPYQIEIESEGGSDGGHIDRGPYPVDWAFVGVPERLPHSSGEVIHLGDLRHMADLLVLFATDLEQTGQLA